MKIFFAFALSLLGLQAFSQSDSTDLNLYTEPYVFEDEIDSMLFGDGNYGILTLEMPIDDIYDIGKVLIDLSFQGGDQVIIRKNLNISDIEINDNIAKINIGLIDLNQIYDVYVTVFTITGVGSPTIKKVFNHETSN